MDSLYIFEEVVFLSCDETVDDFTPLSWCRSARVSLLNLGIKWEGCRGSGVAIP